MGYKCCYPTVQLDRLDRNHPPRDSSNQLIDLNAENPNLDRQPAEQGNAFKPTKLKISVKKTVNGKKKTATHKYQHAQEQFDPDDAQHIRDLNRWRHGIIRTNIGLRGELKRGERWHSLELAYLRNRYAAQRLDPISAHPNWAEITTDYNESFDGATLPGEHRPGQRRTHVAISSKIHISWIAKQDSRTQRDKNRMAKRAIKDLRQEDARKHKEMMDAQAQGEEEQASEDDEAAIHDGQDEDVVEDVQGTKGRRKRKATESPENKRLDKRPRDDEEDV